MSIALPRGTPAPGPARRLAWALGVSLLIHVFLVSAIGFRGEPPPPRRLPVLDLTLVRQPERSPPPREAEALAQFDNDPGPVEPDPEPLPRLPETPAVETALEREPVELVPPAPAEPVPPAPPTVADTPPTPAPTVVARPTPKPDKPVATPSAAVLMQRGLAMAELSADIDQSVSSYRAMPRQRHITARTREFKYAQYMTAWVAKVERVGNLNYPEEARRERLSGSLILDVALTPDGHIEAIEFMKSSGHPALDEAAVRIVEMAAPYAPFPEDIRAETDLLHITRTWQFMQDNRLRGE